MPFTRTQLDWQLRTRTLALGRRTVLMGILNLTPDSFSDGGQFATHEQTVAHALRMLDEGAEVLDLGGESTRPDATPLTPAEEQARVLPVLDAILKARPEAILSIDTYHAETAILAIAAGAEIVNDVSGHLWDAQMSATCASLGCGCILMHTRGRPQQWRTQPPLAPGEIVPLVLRDLEARMATATATGINPTRIALDPGFGFGKIGSENYPLLAHLSALSALARPIVSGTSRKSFLAGKDSADKARLDATTASNIAAILAGAHILRVHDVAPAARAAAVADAILAAPQLGQ